MSSEEAGKSMRPPPHLHRRESDPRCCDAQRLTFLECEEEAKASAPICPARSIRLRPDDLRTEICTWFDTFLKRHIRTGIVFPLSEAFYYDKVANLKRAFGASPRLTITRCLSNPAHYLGDAVQSTADADGMMIPIPQMSDACIAFLLFQQCRRSVNLAEWFHAFREALGREGAATSDEALARFIVAAGELQHLGFFQTCSKGF